MASGFQNVVIQQADRLFREGTVAGLGEGELVERFVARGDQAAFEAIVARHGPMVLRVCRRMLHASHDVEDAFQATFLVFARKAGGLRDRERVGPWLYGVAFRVASRARAERMKKQTAGAEPLEAIAAPADRSAELSEIRLVIDEEVNRLPLKYRLPVLLCLVEGKTQDEAAHSLRWTAGMVRGRLAKAHERMRSRLTRRGLAPSIGLIAAALVPEAASAAVPSELARATTQAVLETFAGKTALASTTASALAQGVLRSMTQLKLKLAGLALAACAAGAVGVASVLPASAPRAQVLAAAIELAPVAPPLVADVPPKGSKLLVGSLRDEEPLIGLFLVDVEAGTWRKLAEGSVSVGRLSPDGRSVAFCKITPSANGDPVSAVWLCDAAPGEEPRKLAEPANAAFWSADGQELLVASTANIKERQYAATLMRRDGTKVKELELPAREELVDWSADGEWMLTLAYPDRKAGELLPLWPNVYARRLDGSSSAILLDDARFPGPRFVPGKKRVTLAGVEKTTFSFYSLCLAERDGSGMHRIVYGKPELFPFHHCWSPDGKQLAVEMIHIDTPSRMSLVTAASAPRHIELFDEEGQPVRKIELPHQHPMPLDWR